MKELSIKEKAKAYDEALKKAKDMLSYKEVRREDMEYLFPELKESEDERIRKMLIEQMERWHECALENNVVQDIKDSADAIAWLEKQDEQKATIIIPKFRVGDEIKTSNEESLTVTEIDEKGYWSEDLFICCFDDADKWKLVEQKPVEEVNDEDYGIDGLYAAMDILNKTLGQVYGYQSDDGILEHKAAMTAVKKLYKQRSFEWSDVDKNILFRTINDLKFLRDTISIDPKYAINIIDIEREITWLKSLRPQSLWKPSDEQIKLLREVQQALLGKDCHNRFVNFMYELKRLREE